MSRLTSSQILISGQRFDGEVEMNQGWGDLDLFVDAERPAILQVASVLTNDERFDHMSGLAT